MDRPRYVVLNQEGEWRVRQARRRLSACFASKSQALYAAIELAERDGAQGSFAEVIVRHEDNHFVTEWAYGREAHHDDVGPYIMPQSGKNS
jgi:hypothetical protein